MKVFVLTFGGPDTASTKFRILQYRDLFAASGIELSCAPAKEFSDFRALQDYDTVVLQKTLLPVMKLNMIHRWSKRLIYDSDDLIWLSPQKKHNLITRLRIGFRLRAVVRLSDLCIAANGVIAGDLKSCGAVTTVVPMSLDGRIWQDVQRKGYPLTIGWSGAPKNLVFVRQILPELISIQHRFPDVRWMFHSGDDPEFNGLRYTYLPFKPNQEYEAVQQFDIGLLPLPDDPFVRGKSPIKALQYFASRIAVAGSPIGATCEILKDGENALWVRKREQWVDILTTLISDNERRRYISAAARLSFEKKYDMPIVFEQLKNILIS